MPIIAKATTFKPAPEGLHRAVCCDVVDLGLVETEFKGKKRMSHKVQLRWQIDVTNEENGLHFLVTRRYTLSLDKKASLRKDLESWRGRKFTDEELAGFDLEVLIGINCQLQIVHEGEYANVSAIVGAPRDVAPIAVLDGYVRVKDREHMEPVTDGEATDETPF